MKCDDCLNLGHLCFRHYCLQYEKMFNEEDEEAEEEHKES